MLILDASSVMIGDSKGPLVFSKWPPPQQTGRSQQSIRQQILYHLRGNGRIPSNMVVKKVAQPLSQRLVRPMKLAQMPLKNGAPLVSAPSYYRPTISTPPRYRFRSSPPAPNSGEYVYENPFGNHNSIGFQPVRIYTILQNFHISSENCISFFLF